MSINPIFKISDGTTTIDLLNLHRGIHLNDWIPAISGLKGGGVYQDSDISFGRYLAFGVYETVNEVLSLKINSHSQDAAIKELNDLLALLLKARNYWLTDWQNAPVYIIAKSAEETNTRYAIIHGFQLGDIGTNPYTQPFFSYVNIATLDNLNLGIERGHWLGSLPGVGSCLAIANQQTFFRRAPLYTNPDPNAIQGDASGHTRSFFEHSSGIMLAGDDGDVLMSSDNNGSWGFATTLPTAIINGFVEAINDDMYAFDDDGIYRSTSPTLSIWTAHFSTSVGAMRQGLREVNTDDLFIVGRESPGTASKIWRSQNNGSTWSVIGTGATGTYRSIVQTTTDRLLVGDGLGRITYSDDNGATWVDRAWFIDTDNLDEVIQLRVFDDGYVYTVQAEVLYRSTDDGVTWGKVYTAPYSIQGLMQDSSGRIWMRCSSGAAAAILRANDTNLNFEILQDDSSDLDIISTSDVHMEIYEYPTTGLFFCGNDGEALETQLDAEQTIGPSADCDNTIFVANKLNLGNVTDIKTYEDSPTTWTDNYPGAKPYYLLPSTWQNADALYVGITTEIYNSSPFSNAVFRVDGAIRETISTQAWQYYNGSWVALTTLDHTFSGVGSNQAFSKDGQGAVIFEPPSDWTTVAIDGVTAYWIRVLGTNAGSLDGPQQITDDVFIANQPYVTIPADSIAGDLPALARLVSLNYSDADGRGGSAPNLWSNRLIVGLRTLSRGAEFQGYLNVADANNGAGISVSVGTNTTFQNALRAGAGRMAQYNPAGVEAMATRATISLAPAVARDFYGTFHAYLRVERTAGASTDFDIRLQITSGSGGIGTTTDSVQVQTTTAFELLDLGQITIPAGGLLSNIQLGDLTTIAIQASAASGTPNLNIFDLILIPADEWSIDAVDPTNSNDSIIGSTDNGYTYIDIDSVTDLKRPIQALVKAETSDLITSIYNAITPTQASLQTNAQQQLWMISAQTSATGTSFSWIAAPEILSKFSLYASEQYLTLRGAE